MNFAKFQKTPVLRPVTFLKKILWHCCFPVNFAKFLRAPFGRGSVLNVDDIPVKSKFNTRIKKLVIV